MQSTLHPIVRLDPIEGLDALVHLLAADGFRIVGPVVRDGAIEYDEVTAGDDLPRGITVELTPGRARVHRDGSSRGFAFTPGADSWKRFVFPAEQEVVRVRRRDGSIAVTRPPAPDRPLALIGARDCELRALAILDRVMLDPEHPDPRYSSRREGMFVVAVTCGTPSTTCWCTSIGGGPEPRSGFDLRLTEIGGEVSAGGASAEPAGHHLLAEAGSDRGAAVLARLAGGGSPATDGDRRAADEVVARAVAAMPPRIAGEELPRLLEGCELDAHWEDVAARCLSCGNCTMVCPTCFCSTFDDTTDLLHPDEAVRRQRWVSCFQLDHSNLAGRPVRSTISSRYRQWLTHKLVTWPEQFGTNGCVGCGRCTTWCPAGIDIVHEAAALVGTSAVEGTS